MRNIKFVSAFAVCGFLLSFVFGLFSHSSFLSIFVKALIFALCFAVLGFVIDFVFGHFLADDTGSEFSSEAAPSSAPSSTGQMVDITIQDEELTPGQSENHYLVGDSHQMLNDSDMKRSETVSRVPPAAQAAKPVTSEASEIKADSNEGFVPLRKEETYNNVSTKEAVQSESVQSASSMGNSSGISLGNEGIDTLPDMGSIAFGQDNSQSDDEPDTDTGDEFVSTTHSRMGDGEVAEVKDAALLAKAISSVLSNEDS